MSDIDWDAAAAKFGATDPPAPAAIDWDKAAAKFGAVDPTVSTSADVGKAAAYALPKAAAGFMGLPRDLSDLGAAVRNKLTSYLPDDWQGPVNKVDSVLRGGNPVNAIAANMPGSGQIRENLEQTTGPWYDPQTRAGKVADVGIQTAATMGRNLVTTPVRAALTTAGMTTGNQVAGALTGDNPWVMLAGSLVGGAPAVLANARVAAAPRALKQAIGGISQPEIDAAIARQNAAAAQGVPLMGSESLPVSGIQPLTSDIAASRSGGAVINPYLAQRPDQVRSAVGGLLGSVAPESDPRIASAAAQKAAETVIKNAEQARTAAVSPMYEAASGENIPPQSLRPVANEIQNLLYGSPIGAPSEKALGGWYNQLFPHSPVAPEMPVASGATQTRSGVPGVNPATDDIVTAVRKLGGINPNDEAVGSLAKANPFNPDPRFGPVWRQPGYTGQGVSGTSSGHSLDRMTELLSQYGYVDRNAVGDVMDKLADHTMGLKQHYAYGYQPQNQDPLTTVLERLTEQMAIKNQPRGISAPSPNQVLPETNVGRLNELYKTLGIQADTSSIGATSADKMAAYPAQQVQGALGDVLKRENPNIANAQRTYADITRNTVDPLTAGPMGVVAGRTGFDAGAPSPVPRVTSVLSNADTARPENIRPLYTAMNQVDPTAFPGMARTWLETAFDKATQRIQSGDNRMMGANFAKTVYGTDQERQNLQEVLRGVAHAHGADPETFVAGAGKLMQTLEATGKVPGIGSPTISRGALQGQLSRNPYSAVADFTGIPKTLGSMIGGAYNASRNQKIAEILTAPDSVQQIVKMAKLNPNGLTAKYYAAALLGIDRATTSQ